MERGDSEERIGDGHEAKKTRLYGRPEGRASISNLNACWQI